MRSKIKSREGAEHKNIAVREINEAQHAINHRVTERYERVDGAERNAIDDLLQEFAHSISADVGPLRRDGFDLRKLAILHRDHDRGFAGVALGIDRRFTRHALEI